MVTCPGDREGRFNPRDEALRASVPEGVEVLRVPGPEPEDLAHGRWRSRAERLSGRLDRRRRWWMKGVLEAAAGVRGRVSLIHAFLDPYETAFPAARLADRFGVPWIADLQDPWALDEVRVHPTHFHLLLDRVRMSRGLSTAAAIVMNTPEAARAVRATFPDLAERVTPAIPNGFDAGDWRGPDPPHGGHALRIVHTGTLHTDLAMAHRRSMRVRRLLGGRVAPVDMLTRSHVHLLSALRSLIEAKPALSNRIELHLAGVLTQADLHAADGHPFVRMHGFLPHAETVRLIRSADLLFLPMHDLPAGFRARLIPCKTYEYLASGRPILAALPDGDARDLLIGERDIHVCRPGDVTAMEAAISTELERPCVAQTTPRSNGLTRFERTALAATLVEVYEAVLGPDSRDSLSARSELIGLGRSSVREPA